MSVGAHGACDQALQAAEAVLARAHAAHGFAWLATYVAALRATLDWAENLERAGKFGERERLILQLGFTEYLAQILGGIPMSQGEMVRPADLETLVRQSALLQQADLPFLRQRLAELIQEGDFGEPGLEDEALLMVR